MIPPTRFRPRLVPCVIAAATVLLGVKLIDMSTALEAGVAAARAADADPAPAAATAKVAPAGQAAPAAPANPASPPAPPAPVYGRTQVPDVPAGESAARDPLLMSPSEIEVLQKLSERRSEIDKRAAEMAQRAVLLEAAEKRMDEKIARLQSLEKEIAGTVEKQDEDSEARVKSLVRIYETMKPREAARIFEQLDMPVLLSVLENMREMKAAPVLASMDPAKAKAVTLALAERRNAIARAQQQASQVAQGPQAQPPQPRPAKP
jgi:flagellar motility protein MotE (MotC chaperone)